MTDHNTLDGLQGGQLDPSEYFHATQDEWTALTANQPFGAGRVLYSDADGHINHDARHPWDATNQRLGIGRLAPLYSLHIYKADPVLLIQDTDSGLATANATLRLAESGAAGGDGDRAVDNYWDVLAGPGSINFSYQVRRGATLLFEILHTTQQVLVNAGSAPSPGLARVSYPDDGMYWPGDGLLAASLGGTERFRWSGDNVGMVPGGQLFLDGVTCDGDTYLKERALNTLSAYAGGALSWEFTSGAIVPGADNARDIGTSSVGARALYLSDANASAPATDGEVRVRSTDNALEHRMGSVVHRNGMCIYSGSPVEDNVPSTSERALDSFTIPSAYWKIGKRFTIVATILVEREGNGNAVTMRLKLGSTVVIEKTMSIGAPQSWGAGHFDFEMSFVVGAIAGSGATVYPTRTIRAYTSYQHSDFGVRRDVTSHQMYPMEPDDPGLAIATNAAQAVSVVYVTNSADGPVQVYLQGLTIYAT